MISLKKSFIYKDLCYLMILWSVKLPSNDICKLFNIPNQSAGFKITSTSYNQENIIVDYSIAYVQGYNVSIILDYFKQ